jgi:hypothetical protein
MFLIFFFFFLIQKNMMISRIRFINQEIKNKVTFPHKLIDGHFVSHTQQ